MVPYHCAGAEADAVAAFHDPPADIHIIAGRREDGIESAGLSKELAPEGHVAAWHRTVQGVTTAAQGEMAPRGRRGDNEQPL